MNRVFTLLLLSVSFLLSTEIKVFPLKLDLESPQKRPYGAYDKDKDQNKENRLAYPPQVCGKIQSIDDIYTKDLQFKLMLFDAEDNTLGTISNPHRAYHPVKDGKADFILPTILRANEIQTVYFKVLPEMAVQTKKAVLVVIHESHYFVNATPNISVDSFEYPDKEKVLATNSSELKSESPKIIEDKIAQIDVRTGLLDYPEFSLFLKMPQGIERYKEVKGVIAICLVTRRNNVEVRSIVEGININEDYKGLFAFADANQLAILAWGVGPLVNVITNNKSFDEVSRVEAEQNERNFDSVANAWENGVNSLVKKYQIPENGYLGWGASSSAQWIHRLTLRKSHRFLAIHIHVNSSYDLPTDEGRNTIWLVTTGEKEWGYESAKSFYQLCRDKHYPIIFKAQPKLGHAGSPYITKLGMEFFRYALSVKPIYDQVMIKDKDGKINLSSNECWLPDFNKPPFIGDFLNQTFQPTEKADFIPASSRVLLPNEYLARLWLEPKY